MEKSNPSDPIDRMNSTIMMDPMKHDPGDLFISVGSLISTI